MRQPTLSLSICAIAIGVAVWCLPLLPSFAEEGMTPGHGTGQGQQSPNAFREHGYAKGQGRGQGLGPGYGHGPAGRVFELFRSIDKNGDGLISPDEAAARRERMFQTFAGKDKGELSAEQFTLSQSPKMTKSRKDDSHKGFQDLRFAGLQARRKQVFKTMDANSDGKVTKEEFMAIGKKHFDSSDLDKDGYLTAWEFSKQHQRF